MKYNKRICDSRAAKKIAVWLLGLLALSISFHAYLAFSEVSSLSTSSTFDTLSDRLASLSLSLERFSVDAKEQVTNLASLVAAYSLSQPVSRSIFENSIREFAAAHPEYCHVYYEDMHNSSFHIVAEKYTEARESIDSFIKADPEFKTLLDNLRASGNKDIQISGLLEYTYPDGTKTPFVHVMAPVRSGEKIYGYLALTLDLKYVLDEIRGSERLDEAVFLSDHDGKFLTSTVDGRELTSYLKDKYSERAQTELFSSEPVGHFIDADKVFSYRHITLPGIRQGAEDDNFWTLASVSNRKDLFLWKNRLAGRYGGALATSLVLILLIGAMIVRIKHRD